MSDITTIDTHLGELADLEGTWKGKGFNMLAVPDPKSGPDNYRVIAQPYEETIEFSRITGISPADGVPNRKLDLTQFVSALEYTQHVVDFNGDAIHHENGLWLMLDDTVSPSRIARQSSVPHGNSLLAPGTTKVVDGAPLIEEVCVLPSSVKAKVRKKMKKGMSLAEACQAVVDEDHCGYLKPFFDEDQKFKQQGIDYLLNPNQFLVDNNKELTIVSTSVFTLDTTEESGGVLNIPFFNSPKRDEPINNAITCPALTSTFWVNTIKNDDGSESKELQYTQNTTIEFFAKNPKKPKKLIVWPHVDVASMKKVED